MFSPTRIHVILDSNNDWPEVLRSINNLQKERRNSAY